MSSGIKGIRESFQAGLGDAGQIVSARMGYERIEELNAQGQRIEITYSAGGEVHEIAAVTEPGADVVAEARALGAKARARHGVA